MRVDLHNHTPLCNHATGTPREFVLKAIEQGIDIYGFSDHAPMDYDLKYRMNFSDMPEYEKEIKSLKEEFKKEIDIRLAYEVDFINGKELVDKRIHRAKVDYLIGSVHFLNSWGFDNPEYISEYKNRDLDTIWQEYFDAIEAMAKSGYFNIAGHFDLIKVFNYKPKKDIKIVANSALKAIKSANMAIEINAAGLRKPVKELYPSKDLLEVCYELDIPITFSSDAHKIDDIGFNYDKAIALAKEVGYTKCVTFADKQMQLHKF